MHKRSHDELENCVESVKKTPAIAKPVKKTIRLPAKSFNIRVPLQIKTEELVFGVRIFLGRKYGLTASYCWFVNFQASVFNRLWFAHLDQICVVFKRMVVQEQVVDCWISLIQLLDEELGGFSNSSISITRLIEFFVVVKNRELSSLKVSLLLIKITHTLLTHWLIFEVP